MKKLITLLALICLSAISFGQTNYYSAAAGDLDLVTTWGTNTDGTGANPANFTTASQIFNIRNRATATIGAAWTVSGGTSKIIVGDGISPCNFTIPAAFAVTGTVDASATGTLTIQNSTNPTLGTLNAASTVVYDGVGAQTVLPKTYGNLTIQNDRGGADVTLSGSIVVPGLFSLTATNVGTYVTTGNTFNYSTTTGGRTIYSVIPYNNLTSGNTSGTNTVDGNLSVAATMLIGNGGTVDMGTNDLLTVTTLSLGNSSVLKTQSLSANPIPSGKVIGGTVNYNAASGGQTIVPETSHRNLTLGNTSGTSTASGDLVVNTTLTTTAGGGLDMSTNKMSGTMTTISNNGTVRTQYAGSDPFTSGRTWNGTGTVLYNGTGAQTIVAGTYSGNLTISNARAGNDITLEAGTVSVTGIFTVTATGVGNYITTGNTFRYNTTSGGRTIVTAIPYNNLISGNTSGTNAPDGTLTINGTLTTTNGGTLDMGTDDIAGGTASISNNGTVRTASLTNPALPSGLTWTGTTGLVVFSSTTGGQHIPTGTYKTITCQNTSGTNTVVGGDITLSGVLTTSAAGGTLDMGTNALISSSSITNTGTIKTQNTSAAPLPTGKTWSGTVEYDGAGSQTMVGGTFVTLVLSGDHGGGNITLENGSINLSSNFNVTATNIGSYITGTNTFTYTGNGNITVGGITYNNLSFTGTSGTKTAGDNITINGALSIASNVTLAMTSFDISGTLSSVTHNGTITTASTSNPALPTGKDWSGGTTGLVSFVNLTGGQFIPGGTYKTLTCSNTSGANTVVGGDITMTGVLTTSAAGGTLDMGTNALLSSSTITNTGTIKTQNTSAAPLPTGKTWGGTVEYDGTGSQMMVAGTFATLALSGDHGAGTITLENGTINLSSNFNVTATNIGGFSTGTNTFNYTGNNSVAVGGITYNNLSFTGTAGTKTAGDNVTVNGALSIASNVTIAMNSFDILGTLSSVTHNGTIATTSTSNPAFPAGKDWSGGTTGLVSFVNPTGGQFIPGGTYKTLTCTNTSGTNAVVGGDLDITGVLTTSAAGGTLDMGTNAIVNATTITNTGTLLTQNTTAAPLPSGKTYLGTVNYNAATGGQTITQGTYTTLTLDNTSGTNTAGGLLTVNTALNINDAAATLDMTTFDLAGTLTTITNNGLITTDAVSGTPLTAGKTWDGTGTVRYNVASGGQTIMTGIYNNNLTLMNSSGINTASNDITANATLTTTAGGTFNFANVAYQLLGATMTAANSGIIQTVCTVNPAIPAGKNWGGSVIFARTNGGQAIPAGTYNDLAFNNTSGTNTAVGDVQVDGAFVTTNGGTLVMGLNQLSGAMTSVTHNGTITTTSVADPAIPSGKDWTGTGGTAQITYAATTGNQFIPAGSYKTLVCSNTSNTNTVNGDIDVATGFTTSGAGGTLNMGANLLTGAFTATNTGTLRTQNTTATPIPTGKTWAGTVNYDAATGGQTVVASTSYATLTIGNTSGTNTAGAALTVNTALNVPDAGGALDMTTFDLGGTVSTITNNGLITTDAVSVTPLPSGKTWGGTGTVRYNAATGSQTVMTGIYTNSLTLMNSSGTNTASNDITVNATLTTTAGGTFDFPNVGYQLLGATMTAASSGIIQTICTVIPAIPNGKTWGGTIIYARTNGLQAISAGTYNNVTLNNASGTNTATGAVQVDGALVTTSGGTFAMGLNQLSGALTSVTHDGTITTTSVANPAIPSGKDWSGTGGTAQVTFAATTGNQFIPTGTYKTLVCSNTSNTNTANGDLSITTGLTTTAGGTLNMGTNLLSGAFTPTNAGTIRTQNATSNPIPSGRTWAGTITYDGTAAQTLVTGTFANMALSSARVGSPAITLENGTINVSGNFNMSATGVGSYVTGTNVFIYSANATRTVAGITYNDLTFTNTANTKTADGNVTVRGALTTTTGTAIFALASFALLDGGGMTVTNNGTINTASTNNTAIPTGKNWSGTTGNVTFSRATGGQFIPAGTFKTLTCQNTSGTNTAVGNLVISGTFTTAGAGGTVNLGTNTLSATTISNTATSTIRTQNTSATPLPSGKTIGGTVRYDAATGGQTIVNESSYVNLAMDNTSGTNTASGNIVVNGALTTGAATTVFDMATFTLSGNGSFSSSGAGKIMTASSAAAPIKTGITWPQTIEYYRAIGGQTIMNGTYNGGLINSNTSNTNTAAASSAITINGDLTLSASSVLADNNRTITVNGNITGTGTHNASASGKIAMTAAAGTISAVTLGNLELNNAGGFSLVGTPTINGTLTLTSGLLTIGANNLVLGTAAPAIAGTPSSSNMIVANSTGQVRKNFSATGSYLFPIGDNTPNYTPLDLNVTSGTAGGGAYAGVNVVTAKHPSNVNSNDYLNRYWAVSVSGFTTPVYSLTAIYVPADVVGTEASVFGGEYAGALPWVIFGAANTGSHFITATALSSAQSDFTGIKGAASSVSVLPTNPTICSGSSVALAATPAGDAPFSYTWAPSTGLSATTGSSVVASPTTGGSPTTVVYTVTMTDGNGLTSTATSTVSVNPAPAIITGTFDVCEGLTTTLSDVSVGGTWSSSDLAKATVGIGSGIVTGVDAGTTIISYILSPTCFVTQQVTVNNQPAAITGTADVCIGLTTTLGNADAGGNWTSGTPAVATVGAATGVVTGVLAGVSQITYTITGGCFSTVEATVNPLPSSITGTLSVCEGSTTTLSDIDAGGVWTSAVTSVATVGTASGIVTGVANGTVDITYTLPTGCFTVANVTVNTQPGAITGTADVCIGSTTTLGNAVLGGSWTSSTPANATIGFVNGIVTGVSLGVSQITYTHFDGCYSTVEVTVNAYLDAGTITGVPDLNVGSSSTFTTDGSGGAWSASNANATVSPVGLVTGVTGGTVTISYAATNSCGTDLATYAVNINSIDMAITGAPQTCVGYTTQLAHPFTGGTWSSSNTSIATVGSGTGVVTGVSYGLVTISYHAAGSYATVTVLVNSYPPPITGSSNVCNGLTNQLGHVEPGGVWATSDAGVATVNSSGLVTGISLGSTTITYTVNSTCHITKAVGVYVVPGAIAGTATLCQGSTSTFTNATPIGLSWTSSNTAIATIGSGSGVVTGISGGTATITYTTTVGCTATQVVTVTAAPEIAGAYTLCATTSTTLSPSTPGGTWSSSNAAVATIGSASGIVSGIAGGTTRITYTLSGGCYGTKVITVNHMPSAIAGTMLVCAGNTVNLTSATPGCAWSSGTPAAATIGGTGIVTGVGAGTTIISYTHPLGCRRLATVTVNAAVNAIAGVASVCAGFTTALTNATPGGAWTSTNGTIASVSGGVVTGVTAGNVNISYTVSAGCKVGRAVTVNALPATITGTNNACLGFTATLNNATPGGTWSSSNAAIASVGSNTGIVTAVTAGTATITYTSSNTCRKTATFTAKALPAAITGVNFACVGTSCTLFCTSGSGVSWTSSNTGIATVGSISGEVTGVSGGTATMTFLATSGCSVTRDVTINTTPSGGTITGPASVTTGNTITLSSEFTYGSWSSSDAGVASVAEATISSANVTGVSLGAATITYTVNNGCGVGFSTVNVTVPSRPGGSSNGGTVTLNNGDNVTIYPNPTYGELNLVAPEAGNFYVFSIDGKQVAEFTTVVGKTTLELPKTLAAGIYACRYVSDSGRVVMISIEYQP